MRLDVIGFTLLFIGKYFAVLLHVIETSPIWQVETYFIFWVSFGDELALRGKDNQQVVNDRRATGVNL